MLPHQTVRTVSVHGFPISFTVRLAHFSLLGLTIKLPLLLNVIKSFGEDLYPKGKPAVLTPKSDDFRKLESWCFLGKGKHHKVAMVACIKSYYEF
jgi:hypothetical protein